MTVAPNRVFSLLVLAAALSAQDPTPRPDGDFEREVAEWRAVRTADAVVVARVARVQPSPGIWCGRGRFVQVVTWRVERVVDGAVPPGELDVGHLLVFGAPLVSADGPFLRPDLVYAGARALLCLRLDEGGEVHAVATGAPVVMADAPRKAQADHAAILSEVFALPELRAYWHLEVRGAAPRCRLDGVVPVPFDARVAGRRVEFLPPELLGRARHLQVDSLRLDGDEARVEFAMQAEGVVGFARLVRDGRRFRVVEHEVAER